MYVCIHMYIHVYVQVGDANACTVDLLYKDTQHLYKQDTFVSLKCHMTTAELSVHVTIVRVL